MSSLFVASRRRTMIGLVSLGLGTFAAGSPVRGQVGACCLPDGSCFNDLGQADCVQNYGQFLGDDTACVVGGCQPFGGACCFGEMFCVPLTEAVCTASNGTYQGLGVPCAGDGSCPGGCQVKTDCFDGNPCTDDDCDVPTGECSHDPVAGPCNDGSSCTSNDTCVQGSCHGDLIDLIDLASWASVYSCLGGPQVSVPDTCDCLDLNGDDRADLADLAEWQRTFGG